MRKQGGKKAKSRDDRPARNRYWMSGRLQERKVAHLMRYCGMEKAAALRFWLAGRQGRVRTAPRLGIGI